MAETKRMHYVPRTYLKYFAHEKGNEFYIQARSKKAGKLFTPNISNVCVENDIYLLNGETEEQRQRLEKMYNDLFENGYDALYKILTDDAREFVTMEERYDIISFVVSMFFRNNVWGVGYSRLMDEAYATAYYVTKENNEDSFFFGEQEVSIIGKTLEQLQRESRDQDRQLIAKSTAQRIFELIRLRVINDVVTVTKATDSFITSDNPVVITAAQTRQRPVPIDPTNGLSIPIDKNHILQLRPWGHELDRTMLGRMSESSFMSSTIVETNNQSQYLQPGRFLLGTEEAIKNFEYDPTGENLKKKLRAHFIKKM